MNTENIQIISPSKDYTNISITIKTWLKSLGYYKIEIEKQMDNSFVVIADGNLRQIFLDVKVFSYSKKQVKLTSKEKNEIQKQARNSNREPWTAIVKMDKVGESVEKIEWANLSLDEI